MPKPDLPAAQEAVATAREYHPFERCKANYFLERVVVAEITLERNFRGDVESKP